MGLDHNEFEVSAVVIVEVTSSRTGKLVARFVLNGQAVPGIPWDMLRSDPSTPQEGDVVCVRLGVKEQILGWVESLRTKGLNRADQVRYRVELETLASDLALVGWDQVTHDQLVTWLSARRQRNRKSPGKPIRGKTYNAIVDLLQLFFAHAHKRGWIAVNPAVGLEHASEQDSEDGSRALNLEELRAIIRVAGTPTKDRRRTTDRYYAYVVAGNTTLRRSTLARVTWGMFSHSVSGGDIAGEFRLPRKSVKKARRTQIVPLNAEATRALLQWKAKHPDAKPEDRIFPRLPDYHQIRADMTTAGYVCLTPEGDVGWNSVRKYCINALAEQVEEPLVLNALTGHSSMQITMDSYVRGMARKALAEVQQLPHLNGLSYPQSVHFGDSGTGAGLTAPDGAGTPDPAENDNDDPSAQPTAPEFPKPSPRAKGRRSQQSCPPAHAGAYEGLASATPDALRSVMRKGPDRLSSDRAPLSDPDGIRTRRGGQDGGRFPNGDRQLALSLAESLSQLATAVVRFLKEPEHGAGNDG